MRMLIATICLSMTCAELQASDIVLDLGGGHRYHTGSFGSGLDMNLGRGGRYRTGDWCPNGGRMYRQHSYQARPYGRYYAPSYSSPQPTFYYRYDAFGNYQWQYNW